MMIRHMVVAATMISGAAIAEGHHMNKGFMGWTGKIDANMLMQQGNTDKSTYGVAVKGERDFGVWGLEGHIAANSGKTDGTRDAESYKIGIQGNRDIDAETYAFVAANYTKDNFSGYDYVADQVIGLGRHFMDNGVHSLKGQFGLGLQQSETDAGVDSNEFVAKPELNYAWQINEGLEFTQDLGAAIASDLTTLKSRTAIRNQLAGNLFLQAAYEVENKSDVPVGNKETDTKTTLGLSYGF